MSVRVHLWNVLTSFSVPQLHVSVHRTPLHALKRPRSVSGRPREGDCHHFRRTNDHLHLGHYCLLLFVQEVSIFRLFRCTFISRVYNHRSCIVISHKRATLLILSTAEWLNAFQLWILCLQMRKRNAAEKIHSIPDFGLTSLLLPASASASGLPGETSVGFHFSLNPRRIALFFFCFF